MRKIVFYISIFIFSWLYAVIFNVADWDFWARLTVGKAFFQLGHVLKHDFLSYTPVIKYHPVLVNVSCSLG